MSNTIRLREASSRINRIKNNPNGIKRFIKELIKEICIMWRSVLVMLSWKQVVFTVEEFSLVDNKMIFIHFIAIGRPLLVNNE